MTPWSAARRATTRGAFPRSSSAASGFFFCGMIELPLVQASDRTTKPNSSLDHRTSSAPRRERCVAQVAAAERKSRTKSRFETASIEFGDHAVEAELGGDHAAVGVEVHAGQRAGAERETGDLRTHEAEPLAVAREHPHVGEQVVGEVDGLGALQVRVAGQRPVEMGLGGLEQRRIRASMRAVMSRRRSSVYRATSVVTWSLRERAVCSARRRGRQLGDAALDGHVDVLVVGLERERALAQLGLNRIEAAEQRGEVVVADDPACREHAGVGARLRDVVGPRRCRRRASG